MYVRDKIDVKGKIMRRAKAKKTKPEEEEEGKTPPTEEEPLPT